MTGLGLLGAGTAVASVSEDGVRDDGRIVALHDVEAMSNDLAAMSDEERIRLFQSKDLAAMHFGDDSRPLPHLRG